MRVLIDTCVVSELQRNTGSARIRSRVDSMRARDLYLSVITLGELTRGLSLLSAGKKKTALDAWVQTLEQEYASRILPVDADIARIWGEVVAGAGQRGRTIGAADGLIAATGIRHGLHVMTRNISDFRETGALVINPWEDA